MDKENPIIIKYSEPTFFRCFDVYAPFPLGVEERGRWEGGEVDFCNYLWWWMLKAMHACIHLLRSSSGVSWATVAVVALGGVHTGLADTITGVSSILTLILHRAERRRPHRGAGGVEGRTGRLGFDRVPLARAVQWTCVARNTMLELLHRGYCTVARDITFIFEWWKQYFTNERSEY